MGSPLVEPRAPDDTSPETSGLVMIVTMGVIGLISAVLIVGAYRSTLETIKENKAAFLEKSVFEVLPGTARKITFGANGEELREMGEDEPREFSYHAGYNASGELTGIAIVTEGQGFADTLRILYGYSLECHCIVGMKVLDSRETPGLGDKIMTDPAFRANFDALDVSLNDEGKEIRNPIVLVKPRQKTDPWQIEAISGATISSRAIADMLTASTARSIPFVEQHLAIFKAGGKHGE
ncbi:MAG: FMN-binding protein [Gammaproteobacteria bacterium]|nr:MAG: FMN-binding protein [Gammaproteobacteria bacterium]